MNALSNIVMVLTLWSQVHLARGFESYLQPSVYKGNQITKAPETHWPATHVISGDDLAMSTVNPTANPDKNDTGPVVFVPVVEEEVFDPNDFYSVLPPPYPIAFAGRPDPGLFAPTADNFQEPFFPADEYVQYFPMHSFPPPQLLPLRYYHQIPEQTAMWSAIRPVESANVPTAKPAVGATSANTVEHANKLNESGDLVLQRILKIVNEFVQANKTNFDDLKVYIRPEEISSLEASQMNTIPEPRTTTITYSTVTSTATAGDSRMDILIDLNQTVNGDSKMNVLVDLNRTDSNSETSTTANIPVRRIIEEFVDENGNPCVKEIVSAHLKTFYVFTCEEKGVLKTTTKSNVIHYTDELTTVTELHDSRTENSAVNSSSLNSTTDTTAQGVELKDFVFLTYE